MDLNHYLQMLADRSASDLFLSPGAPPNIKIEGLTRHVGTKLLTALDVRDMAYSVMNERQQAQFEDEWEMNLALAMGDIGRFRINVYRQRGDIAMAVRYVTNKIPSIEELNLPTLLKDLIMLPRGLILFVGAAGSGKSTTMASMIDYRNQNRTGHILTVEEPIEYMHSHKQSVVDQREVGLDTRTYATALKNAMREAPDVIMIGEIRDRETMQQAITYAETGHLCLSTLHANNANQTLDRIINFFPETARTQVLLDMSLNLKAVISQRLLKSVHANVRRVPAVEVLLSSPYVSDLIIKGEIGAIKEAMKHSTEIGMQTFDESLFRLFAAGQISYQDAIEVADSRTDLALRIRLQGLAPEGVVDNEMAMEEMPPPKDEARGGRIGG
ncbi:MAG: type IV pili twitching motility protein PilT [Gammaproteobacteria bacterium RIFCSPHIGHO2_12_FULL_63_22]|nr:MAG: type IV pili twitching motility protein PilT [Gammaproteobacteria bacterium RIFCSPHIGHO2_12_FULL_63_22]